MSTNDNHPRETVSRRQLLTSGAIVGGTLLAGCSGDETGSGETTNSGGDETEPGGGDETEDSGGSNGGTPLDESFTTFIKNAVPTDMTTNPYSTGQPLLLDGGGDPRVDKMARYNAPVGEILPEIATDWSLDGTTATISINTDYVWWDDDTPVTAQDYVTMLKLDEHLRPERWNNVSAVSAADDATVEVQVENEINPTILWNQILVDVKLDVKHAKFVDRLEAIEDASGEDATDEAVQELMNWDLSDPFGNGVAKVINVTSSGVRAELNTNHPAADDLNFEEFDWLYIQDKGSYENSLIQDRVDYHSGMGHPPGYPDQLGDHWEVTYHSAFRGHGLLFNQDADHVNIREVRQAIAYLIDKETTAENEGHSLNVIPFLDNRQTGIANQQVDLWLGDDKEQYPDYRFSEERAAELLESVDYSKDGDEWVDPDGNPLEITITTPSSSGSWANAALTIIDDLDSFGIATEQDFYQQSSEFFPALNSGDFQCATLNWGAGGRTHPFFSFQAAMGDSQQARDWLKVPEVVEVPMPIGDSDGSLEEINVQEEISKLGEAQDESEEQELVKKLAWIHNQQMPIAGWNEVRSPRYISTDDWNTPSKDDDIWTIDHVEAWLARGLLTAKTE